MIAKLTIKTDSLGNLYELVDKYHGEYLEFIKHDPSTSFFIEVDESKLELSIKTLTLAEAVN